MKCPVCQNTELLMTERSGIEIDYCPQCRGVWLDRGELDKIIDRSMGGPCVLHLSRGCRQPDRHRINMTANTVTTTSITMNTATIAANNPSGRNCLTERNG